MNMQKINRRARVILASAFTVFLASGCGGGVAPVEVGQEATLQAVQYSFSTDPATAPGARMPAHADTNSFTLKPSKEFKGFNPEIWNDHKTWYECDCGRHPQQQPDEMPWNAV